MRIGVHVVQDDDAPARTPEREGEMMEALAGMSDYAELVRRELVSRDTAWVRRRRLMPGMAGQLVGR